MLSFFPRGVLDEIFNLIGSVSEDFPSYSCLNMLSNRCIHCGYTILKQMVYQLVLGIGRNVVIEHRFTNTD